MDHVIFNHRLVERSEAHIAPDDRGFRYGDGVFDTVRVAKGRPYQLDWHLARLQRGLDTVLIPFDTATLASHCTQLIAHNKLSEGLLRIQITRGAGGRGYLPDAKSSPTLLIETLALPVLPKEPVKLFLSSYEKISAKALPSQVKLTQGMSSTLARIEADAQNCFDALLLNAQGEICETSAGNIFWLKNNIWHTPALGCGVLDGSTRAILLQLLGDKAQEARAPLDALITAETVIICNVAYGVLAVSQLLPNGVSWPNLAPAQTLSHMLQQHMQRHTQGP